VGDVVRVRLDLAYDGTDFSGWAAQPGRRTVEAELSAAIARIRAGEFRPTPSEFACSDCPALDLVCAGPRLAVAR